MKSVDFRNDPMFLRNQFERDGTFEMPVIKKTKLDLDDIEFIGYDKLNEGQTDKIVHFFLDDYKFEVLWKDPEPRVEKLKEYRAILSPQFSMYTEMPVAIQIHQVFKSRWCGAYFQSKGLKVIPSLVWGEADTFWFSFDGIDEGSVVAVSTVGMRTEKNLFMAGYKEMLRRIKPKAIICYGEPFEEMEGKLIVVDYAKTNNLNQEKSLTCQLSSICGVLLQRAAVLPVAVAADNVVSLNSLAGTPQNAPEKATSGVGGANLDQKLEIGIIRKPGSGFALIFRTPRQFPHTGITESEERRPRTAFLRMIAMPPRHSNRKEWY